MNNTRAIFQFWGDEDMSCKKDEANEFRIGVLGPKSCGKSSIVAKLHRIKSVTGECSKRSIAESSDHDSHLNKVMCIPVHRGHSLGIKIVQDPKFSSFCSVHSFISSDMTSDLASIASDGRVMAGDLLLAVGNISLMNKTPFEIISTLKSAKYDIDNHILITFLRPGKSNEHDTPSSTSSNVATDSNDVDSSISSTTTSNCSASHDVYVDHPTVLLTTSFFCYSQIPCKPKKSLELTSYHMIPRSCRDGHFDSQHRKLPSVVEIVDVPGNDPNQNVLREWIPRMDAFVLVYSADSSSSLLALQKIYIPLLTKLSSKDAYDLPLVIVCNKSENNPLVEDSDDHKVRGEKLQKHLSKRNTLVMEGYSMAAAWNAPFYLTSCGVEGVQKREGDTINLASCMYDDFQLIFEKAIEQCILRSNPLCCRRSDNDTVLTASGIPSFFQHLPFISACLSATPQDVTSIPRSSLPNRKLHHVSFSNQQSKNRKVVEEADDTVDMSSTCDSHDSDISSCSDSDDMAFFDGKENVFSVSKRGGYTHDTWKLNVKKGSLIVPAAGTQTGGVQNKNAGFEIVGSE